MCLITDVSPRQAHTTRPREAHSFCLKLYFYESAMKALLWQIVWNIKEDLSLIKQSHCYLVPGRCYS